MMPSPRCARLLAGLTLCLCAAWPAHAQPQPRVVHVFVALCDNDNQGIVPVPKRLGNGNDPANNLYWGAAYGVKTFFRKSSDWQLVAASPGKPSPAVLERIIFKHRATDTFLVADAYKGEEIRRALQDFLEAAAGQRPETISVRFDTRAIALPVAGNADLVAYVGHNGLMDFRLTPLPRSREPRQRSAVVLACASKAYFTEPLRAARAAPLLWTTGLMAPEAYTLKAALDGWILNEDPQQVRQRAAEAYARYQKCSLRAARNLLQTGW